MTTWLFAIFIEYIVFVTYKLSNIFGEIMKWTYFILMLVYIV